MEITHVQHNKLSVQVETEKMVPGFRMGRISEILPNPQHYPLVLLIQLDWKKYLRYSPSKRKWSSSKVSQQMKWPAHTWPWYQESVACEHVQRTWTWPVLFSVVYRQANNINMLKDGMKIEATHVKKKQLHQYLPPEVVQKKKRVRYLPQHLGTNLF